jgi:threonine dehydratase
VTHSLARLHPIPIEEISAARRQIRAFVMPSLLTRLDIHGAPSEVYLKLENLHPVGSFKLRGVVNAVSAARPETLDKGVWTASAGNMGYALAWVARRRNIACAVIVPDDAPASKLAAIARQGAWIEKVSFPVYQDIQRRHTWSGLLDCPPDSPLNGLLIHPFADPAVMAGNGTIGLEILEDLPEVETVLVPYGGGGLSCGIASAIKARKPACARPGM